VKVSVSFNESTCAQLIRWTLPIRADFSKCELFQDVNLKSMMRVRWQIQENGRWGRGMEFENIWEQAG